jgi:hypothetical protein
MRFVTEFPDDARAPALRFRSSYIMDSCGFAPRTSDLHLYVSRRLEYGSLRLQARPASSAHEDKTETARLGKSGKLA